ncbi:3-beta hydroxysteroid dehydrogenase [Nocardia sp. 2]|uniref:3-beta hydroxysteroid dehydrogenase n=1 Tax=Nocardia acididurans TaxID=2802282 RepID=A0ABS1M8K9_9NOCA|nr:NAD-dependent epimerase/dehydratase family protein [Nocardia acididurans]MBL1076978.1 3-beta hydroxysteroid dehydrogenase [Nocardia acididurans]
MWRGDLDDLDGLRAAADNADAVVHLGNKHDWSDPAETIRSERAAVTALADTLAGSDRPLLLASVLSGLVHDRPAEETDPSPAVGPDSPRGGSENLALAYADKGVRVIAARFAPSVHGPGDTGFLANLVAAARTHHRSAYLGAGTTAWSAVHRGDAATLIRLALDQAPPATILHVVAEQAVTTRDIAEAIGTRLDLPIASIPADNAATHFGFVGRFLAQDMSAANTHTRRLLSWNPTGPTLLDDIRSGAYDHA